MIRYRVIVPPDLRHRLAHLPPNVKRRVHASLRLLETNPRAGKPLEQELTGYWSYPIRPYRIIYWINGSEHRVHLVMVELRRIVYDLMIHRLPFLRERSRRKSAYRRLAGTASLLR